MLNADTFRFEFEVDAFEKAKPDGSAGRFIGGFVSTDHMDREQETVIQEGLDFSPFLEKGYFNDNHDKATDALVGYPTMAEIRKYPDDVMHKGWYVEGELLEGDGTTRADGIWKLAQSLKKAGKRKLGFSVEGGVTERGGPDKKTVRKGIVREVAITRCAINTKTSMDVLAKSLAVGHAGPHANLGPGDAGPLTQEALEGKKKKKKKIKKSTAVVLLQKVNPKVSRSFAERIVDYAVRHYGEAA